MLWEKATVLPVCFNEEGCSVSERRQNCINDRPSVRNAFSRIIVVYVIGRCQSVVPNSTRDASIFSKEMRAEGVLMRSVGCLGDWLLSV